MMAKNLDDVLTWPWPRFLLTRPATVRLTICAGSFLICTTLYMLALRNLSDKPILAIPVMLSAWMFGRKGGYLCLFSAISFKFIYSTLAWGFFFWSQTNILLFCEDALCWLVAAIIIVTLRKMYIRAEELRLKAERGEKQAIQAYEQQRKLNQIKNQFMVNVNHELRTPLTAAYGYFELLHMLLERQGQLDYSLHGPYIKDALRHCAELRTTVNNVLDSIDIDTYGNSLPLEDVPVKAIVGDIFESIGEFCRKQGRAIYLDVPAELTVQANVHCLRHILHHLLSNAFKFSANDAPITISADIVGDDPTAVCISVKDEGPGIPADEITHIFEPFTRLQRDLAGTIRGTGLGLSICKRLVEMMHGQIWVESAGVAGQGSSFSFTLPRKVREMSARIAS